MSNKINHDIMKREVIDREELIEYLTWILEHDGELEKFYDRENLRDSEDDSVPDVLDFRDWLREQDFDMIIRESYFEEYTRELYEDIGEYNPDNFLHRHLNWSAICRSLLDTDYVELFDGDEYHPHNIFRQTFYYHF